MNGGGDPYLDMVARIATDAANTAAQQAVRPIYEVAARAARAAEHADQRIDATHEAVQSLRRESARRARQQDAAMKALSADVADVMVAVVQSDARRGLLDEAQNRAIFEARSRADEARRAATEAQERAETTGQFSTAEIRARQQSDAEIAHKVSEVGLAVVTKGADVVLENRRNTNASRVKVITALAFFGINVAWVLFTIFSKGCHL
jgi:hypothetical protein